MNKIIFTNDWLFMSVVGPSGSGKTRLICKIFASPTTFKPSRKNLLLFQRVPTTVQRNASQDRRYRIPNMLRNWNEIRACIYWSICRKTREANICEIFCIAAVTKQSSFCVSVLLTLLMETFNSLLKICYRLRRNWKFCVIFQTTDGSDDKFFLQQRESYYCKRLENLDTVIWQNDCSRIYSDS